MENRELLKNINLLGFPLFEPEQEINVNATIYEVLKSGNLRLLEGFPVILANAARHSDFDIDTVFKLCKNEEERKKMFYFIILSMSLYKNFHLKFWWTNKIYNKISDKDKEAYNTYLQYLKSNKDFKIMEHTLNTSHIKDIFENYFQSENAKDEKTKSNYEEFSLEFALSQIFPPKQKQLFFKRLHGEKMTKTERSYYYRRVKKKIAALANNELHKLSKKILGSL